MASLITQVKSKLFIHSARKSLHALDGAYASLLHGRSLDFEDLRAYEYGDQVRDIDWRATARLGAPLVRRHRAMRMHTIMFVVDTGRSMAALAHDERSKKDLAILATGVLGVLALRHGDDFTVVYGDAERVRRRAPGRSEGALEHALRTVDHAIDHSTAPSDRDALLSFVTRTISRRMIAVVITDEAPITDETERMLRRLRVQHDVLWLTVRDADPVLDHSTRTIRSDVDSRWDVPDFVQGDLGIVGELAAQTEADAAHLAETLKRMEISHAVLDSQDDAVSQLLRLLNRRSHARL
ncbi:MULTISPECIES: DUF58 domain-containing protein [unclassified Microbacterium]|uniref:DUF58 domain-containing protein n=1 Tax=unclassified Microbacterium TaxID=2609290 RepID=UPI000EAACB59|nr:MULTISPECIES: DUF58 domain-containing protein [unclassified Microbacterium]MBT2484148.1 DUF58 domain-containing protein [Microbacterium sp. ISL-108]RKN67092.1 DUF58 domain-containing protein [Microbacterium sp. CGR2]